MPSPIAHSLAGLALGRLIGPEDVRGTRGWLALSVFAANAPDLDFAAGFAIGQVNLLHGGPTHSLGAALLFAGAGALLARAIGRRALPVFAALAVLYASHVALDLSSGFPERPTALALLWPLHDVRFSLPWQPLYGIVHGTKDASFGTFLGELVHPHNLRAVAVEAALFGALAWAALRNQGRAALPAPGLAPSGGDSTTGP